MPRAALALDIDGTLTTGAPRAVGRLTDYAEANGIPVHINTARPAAYCADPDPWTLDIAARDRHHCLVHPDPVASKVANMRAIQGDAAPECALLVDDRPENVAGVRAHGFGGIGVDASTGITEATVDRAIAHFERCRASP